MLNTLQLPAEWSTMKKLIWLRGMPVNQWGSETLSLTAFAAPVTKTVTKKSKVTSCEVSFTPSQDLHGYDSPWPAGGGVNKFNITTATVKKWQLYSNTFKTLTDDNQYVSYTVNSDESITVTTTSSYYGICFEVASDENIRIFSQNTQVASVVQSWASYTDAAELFNGSALSCTIPANNSACLSLRFNSAGTYTVKLQLENGQSASAWTPYSNICPITGWTGAEVTVSGKNLLKTGGLTLGAPSSTEFSNATKRTFTDGTYIIGLTLNNYYMTTPVVSHSVSENRVTIETSAKAYGLAIPIVGLIPQQNYTFSCDKVSGAIGVSYFEQDGTFISNTVTSQTSIVLTVPQNAYYTLLHFVPTTDGETGTYTNIQLEIGSSASSYTPFRAPSTSSVTFGVQSANKWDEEWVVSHEDINTTTGEIVPTSASYQYFRSKNFIPVQGDTPYYNFNNATTGNYRFFYYDSNKDYISYESRPVNAINTPPANAAYMLFRFGVSSMDFTYQNNIAINFPYTVTTYNPYRNYILGGTADVVQGSGSGAYAEVDMSQLSWRYNTDAWTNPIFYAQLTDNVVQGNMLCSMYPVIKTGGVNSVPDKTIYTSTTYIYLRDDSYTSVQDLTTELSGQQFVYELATPTDFTFPPASEQLTLAKGTNNAWAEMTND